jgi:hypothetical protein
MRPIDDSWQSKESQVPFDIYGTIDNLVQQFVEMIMALSNIVYSVYSFGLNTLHSIG